MLVTQPPGTWSPTRCQLLGSGLLSWLGERFQQASTRWQHRHILQAVPAQSSMQCSGVTWAPACPLPPPAAPPPALSSFEQATQASQPFFHRGPGHDLGPNSGPCPICPSWWSVSFTALPRGTAAGAGGQMATWSNGLLHGWGEAGWGQGKKRWIPTGAGPARASHLPSGQASGDGGGTPSMGGCPWEQACRLPPQPTTQPVPKPAGVAVPTRRSWGGPAALRMLVPSQDSPLPPWPPTPPPSKVSQKLEKQLLLKNLEGRFHIIIVKILKLNVVKKRRGAAAAAAAASGQEVWRGPGMATPTGSQGGPGATAERLSVEKVKCYRGEII